MPHPTPNRQQGQNETDGDFLRRQLQQMADQVRQQQRQQQQQQQQLEQQQQQQQQQLEQHLLSMLPTSTAIGQHNVALPGHFPGSGVFSSNQHQGQHGFSILQAPPPQQQLPLQGRPRNGSALEELHRAQQTHHNQHVMQGATGASFFMSEQPKSPPKQNLHRLQQPSMQMALDSLSVALSRSQPSPQPSHFQSNLPGQQAIPMVQHEEVSAAPWSNITSTFERHSGNKQMAAGIPPPEKSPVPGFKGQNWHATHASKQPQQPDLDRARLTSGKMPPGGGSPPNFWASLPGDQTSRETNTASTPSRADNLGAGEDGNDAHALSLDLLEPTPLPPTPERVKKPKRKRQVRVGQSRKTAGHVTAKESRRLQRRQRSDIPGPNALGPLDSTSRAIDAEVDERTKQSVLQRPMQPKISSPPLIPRSIAASAVEESLQRVVDDNAATATRAGMGLEVQGIASGTKEKVKAAVTKGEINKRSESDNGVGVVSDGNVVASDRRSQGGATAAAVAVFEAWAADPQNVHKSNPTLEEKWALAVTAGVPVICVDKWLKEYNAKRLDKGERTTTTSDTQRRSQVRSAPEPGKVCSDELVGTKGKLHMPAEKGATSESSTCLKWDDRIASTLSQRDWPSESRQTFNAMLCLLKSDIGMTGSRPFILHGDSAALEHNANIYAEGPVFKTSLVQALWSAKPIAGDGGLPSPCTSKDLEDPISKSKKVRFDRDDDLLNGTSTSDSKGIMQNLVRNGLFFKPIVDVGDSLRDGWNERRQVLLLATMGLRSRNARGKNKVNADADEKVILGLAVVDEVDGTLRHLMTEELSSSLGERDSIQSLPKTSANSIGEGGLVNPPSKGAPASGAEDLPRTDTKRLFPSVESWVDSLHSLHFQLGDIEPHRRSKTCWENAWKRVLVRVPLGAFVTNASPSELPTPPAIPSPDENIGQLKSGSDSHDADCTEHVVTIPFSLGHHHFPFPVNEKPLFGFLPLYFFRSGSEVLLPKTVATAQENHKEGRMEVKAKRRKGTKQKRLVSNQRASLRSSARIRCLKQQEPEKEEAGAKHLGKPVSVREEAISVDQEVVRQQTKEKDNDVVQKEADRRKQEATVHETKGTEKTEDSCVRGKPVPHVMNQPRLDDDYPYSSHSYLRHKLHAAPNSESTEKQKQSRKSGRPPLPINGGNFDVSYPNAPLGQLWINTTKDKECDDEKLKDATRNSFPLGRCGTLLGRRWVWDEGYYADGHCNISMDDLFSIMNKASGRSVESGIPSRSASMESGRHQGASRHVSSTDASVSIENRAYCNCGMDHSLRNRDTRSKGGGGKKAGRARRSERSGTSVRMTNVLAELASGKLNPHTLIACEDYSIRPEMRFLSVDNIEKVQPFSIRVCPDAVFLSDLHSHLSDAEVIGFLGGRYVPSERCVYVQAAFPCKSSDSGQTDVEMDPVSQILARDAIVGHGMTVVGWYHSHPSFQPDPSVTDIENQGNYQRLFQSTYEASKSSAPICEGNTSEDKTSTDDESEATEGVSIQVKAKEGSHDIQATNSKDMLDSGNSKSKKGGKDLNPFVGLIVGTYDGQNPTAQSVMRWFHVTQKETGNKVFRSMSTGNSHSQDRRTSMPSSSASQPDPLADGGSRSLRRSDSGRSATSSRVIEKERVNYPMKLSVMHRQFRHFNKSELASSDNTIDWEKRTRSEMSQAGSEIRREMDSRALFCPLIKGTQMPENLALQRDESAAKNVECVMLTGKVGNEEADYASLMNGKSLDEVGSNSLGKKCEVGPEAKNSLIDTSKARAQHADGGFEGNTNARATAGLHEKSGDSLRPAADHETRIAKSNVLSTKHGPIAREEGTIPPLKKSGVELKDTTIEKVEKESNEKSQVVQLRMPFDALQAFKHGKQIASSTISSAIASEKGPGSRIQSENSLGEAMLMSQAIQRHRTQGVPDTDNTLGGDIIISNMGKKDSGTSGKSCDIGELEQGVEVRNIGTASTCRPAQPLPFTRTELAILNLGDDSGVTDEVRGGIIWFAVEREQSMASENNPIPRNRHSLIPEQFCPASSRAIMEYLLRPPIFESESLYGDRGGSHANLRGGGRTLESAPFQFADDDAALVHSIDVVLSHYAADSHRINPFQSWSGAGEKGFVEKDDGQTGDATKSWWRTYYTDIVIGKRPKTGGSNKIKRGHKIGACLLRWARHMQISKTPLRLEEVGHEIASSTFKFNQGDSTHSVHDVRGANFRWDHEHNMQKSAKRDQRGKDVEFVAEVMRLLAARWRESDENKRARRNKRKRASGNQSFARKKKRK